MPRGTQLEQVSGRARILILVYLVPKCETASSGTTLGIRSRPRAGLAFLRAAHLSRPALRVWAFRVPFSPGQLLLFSAGPAQVSLPLGSPCPRSQAPRPLLLLWPPTVFCMSLSLLLSDDQEMIQLIHQSSHSSLLAA